MPKDTLHSFLPHLIFAVTCIQAIGQSPALVSGQTSSYRPPKISVNQVPGSKCVPV